jgi:hypothetical protein
MRKSPSIRGSRTGAILAMATGSLLACGLRAEGGTSYSYVGSTSGSWSNPANWSPSSSYPQAGDTGNLGDATANRVVIYDTGATGALGTLTFAQTDPFENQLDVQKSLTISTAQVLGVTSGTGSVDLEIDPTPLAATSTATVTFSGGLTINSGGVLEMNSGQNSTATLGSQALLTGNVTVNNGGTFSIDQTVSQSSGNASQNTVTGSFSVASGGTVEFGVIGPVGANVGFKTGGSVLSVNRLYVTGNLSLASGSTVASRSGVTDFLQSVSNISIGTLTNGSSGIAPQVGLVGYGTPTLTSDTPINGGLLLRAEGGTYTQSINYVIGATTPGNTLTVGAITFTPTLPFPNTGSLELQSLKLSSNVNTTANLSVSAGGNAGNTITIDTQGNILNFGAAAFSLPAAATNEVFTLTNTVGTTGTIESPSFNLSLPPNGTAVGANLILLATGAGGTSSNLSTNGATTGTISPTSTFNYAGTGTTANFATLTSSRTIGNLAVTTGALQLASSITTGTNSSTTVALNATLDTGNNTLTTTNLTVNGTLSGTAANSSVSLSGMLAGTGTVGATKGITITSTGGLSPAGAGTVGTLAIAANTSALTLSGSGTSNFDLASDSSFDTLNLNGVTVTYAGTLNANFSYAPNVGTTNYAIFSGMGTETGNVTVTSNLPSATDTVTFDPTSGMLTVVATPEPASAMTLGVFSLGLLARRRRRRA